MYEYKVGTLEVLFRKNTYYTRTYDVSPTLRIVQPNGIPTPLLFSL